MEEARESNTEGMRLAVYFINGWSCSDGFELGNSDDASLYPRPNEIAGTVGPELSAMMEPDNARHLRSLARMVRRRKDMEESVLDVLCRMTGRSIVEGDATICVDQFHAMMSELISTSQARNESMWKDLCMINGGKWPTLPVLAEVVADERIQKGFSGETLRRQSLLLDAQVSGLLGRALKVADRIGNKLALTPSLSDGNPATNVARGGQLVHTNAVHMTHMQGVIIRVTPLLEIAIETMCAGALRFVMGISLGLQTAADIHRGLMFAILLAAPSFPAGLVLAGVFMRSHSLRWTWALFTASFVGLCQCLGGVVAYGITISQGVLSGEVLSAMYFVSGGVLAHLGLQKYLRAALAADPDKEVPTVAATFGMILAGGSLVVYDDVMSGRW
jgi:zinc transporter ZupT